MKRIFTLAIAILMALTLSLATFAASYDPASDNELTSLTALPENSQMISVGLTSSSSKTDAEDIGSLTYGLSVIGFKKFNSTVAQISDGLWASSPGNWEVDGTTFYNVKGETGKTDSIYKTLVTYNFGKKMDFDAFGYFTNGTNAYLGAVDLYVSDDGVNWTSVGYYNNIVKNGDTLSFKGYDTTSIVDPKDANNAQIDISQGAGKRGCPFWSLDGVTGQYLRVAVLVGNQQSSGQPTLDSTACSFREMVVYGVEHVENNNNNQNNNNGTGSPNTSDSLSVAALALSVAAVGVVTVISRRKNG